MTPERWQQINTLLDGALERAPGERQAFLEASCGDDAALRREVMSLLDAHNNARSFLEEPAKDYAAPLIPMDDQSSNGLLGTTIDGYRLLDVVGRGGMGIVYKALDVNLDKVVALKMIDPALARDETFVRKFRAEARALARIDSPHIVRVHAMRQTDVGLYIIMEFVDGGTLTDLLADGAMPWPRALPIVRQMLTALEHAHSVSVIHRDIKPGNIMLTQEGVVKVTDFGLAKVRQPDGMATATQGISGTLFYMSPEQVKGLADLDHRSDLYSMGMTIYQMLTGRLPLDRDAGDFAVMRAIVEEKLPSPATYKANLPEHVAKAVMKSLEKDPSRRFQSAREMRAAFEARPVPADGNGAEDTIVDGETPYPPPPPPRPYGIWIGGSALAVTVIALVVYLLWPSPPPPPQQTFLSVNTLPDAVAVYLDGVFIGNTPLSDQPFGDRTGQVTVHLEKDGFRDTSLVVDAGTSQDLTVSLTPEGQEITTATLAITSSPGNARVQINGESHGTTSASGTLGGVTVNPGTVSVVITRNGYKDWRRTYEVTAGETVPVEATLEPVAPPPAETASLLVQVEGSGGSIDVSGENCRGGARCTVGVGDKQVTCTAGGMTATQNVRLRADEQRTLTCYTEQTLAIQVRKENGDPIWATIMVNGEQAGMLTDLPLKRGPGTYTVSVSREGYDVLTAAKTVTIRPAFEEKTEVLVFQIRSQ